MTTGTLTDPESRTDSRQIEWRRIAPWLAMQAGCLLVFVVGWSPVAVGVAIALYLIRMFAVTGFYHRYFSHRSYTMSRPVQFVAALIGASAVQRGALWWAAHHRKHHRSSDEEGDPHSPHRHGFWWSQAGWFVTRGAWRTDLSQVKDFAKYPELVWLDRHDRVVPALLLILLVALGVFLERSYPELGTSASQMVVWGFCISTTVLFHVTSSINTIAHLFGRRPWPTRDQSRNSFLLALLTLGEGWHNNHHWHPGSVQQGFRWWQIDITYYVLRAMAVVGLVSGIKPLPDRVRS